MRLNILQKPILLSFIILASLGLISYVIYDSLQKLLASEQLVRHTEKIIYKSDNILSLAKDIVIASQGFLIAKDSIFLDSLTNKETIISTYIGEIRQLTLDNPRQQQRIDSLNYYIHRHLDLLSRTTSAGVYSRDDKKYIDRIQTITGDIQREEGVLLKERKEINGKNLEVFNRYSIIVFIIMAFFTCLLLIAASNHYSQKNEKDKRAAELIVANTELAFQNAEKEKRAAELVVINKELRKAEDDIRKLNEELEYKVIERTEQLKTANTELESFSYSVSHDLRAPIRAISGYAQILEEDHGEKLDADGTTILHSIRHNSKKMGHLIDDLLAFSQLGRKQVTVYEINMYALVLPIIKDLTVDDTEHRIEFNAFELLPAKGDPSLIKQVWINLLSNAIKYSKYKPKSIIGIGAYKKDNAVIYYIKDNGAGFDMKYYDKLFGVFQRLHSQDEFEGTGIGLAIVQKIVHRHNGTVWAESKEGEGTCFYFSLPDINS